MLSPIFGVWGRGVVSECSGIPISSRRFQIFGTKIGNVGTQKLQRNLSMKFLKVESGNRMIHVDTGDVGDGNGVGLHQHQRCSRMHHKSWELHSYGGPKELQLNLNAKIPIIQNPKDVLVQVMASSINPIDLAMSKGYGVRSLNFLRAVTSHCDDPGKILNVILGTKEIIEFPIVLGRDFAGIIVEMGHEANCQGLRIGDEVYGVVGGVQRNGSQGEFVVVSSDTIRKKPKSLNFLEAASIPYVGLTASAAIHTTGAYQVYDLSRKKFLVLGGSGGIGTFVIQYLRANGAYVVTTCSQDAIELVSTLGADFAIDYTNNENYAGHIKSQAPFDCIMDLTGTSEQPSLYKYLKPTFGQYITLSPPFLRNIDSYGFAGGLAKNITDLISYNLKSVKNDQVVCKWGFFIPDGLALERISQLVERNMIVPVIHQIFKFDELPSAYLRLEQGHLRGKIVVDHS